MDRLGFAIFCALGAVLSRLPILSVFRCGAALGRLAYYMALPYRRLVLRNLAIAFGSEKSPSEMRDLAREHFATLGANLFSSLKIPHLSPDEIRALVEVEGLEHIVAGSEAGEGFTMVIGHIGNWELFAQISAIVFPCPVGTIYQALGNSRIDAEVRRSRAVLGLQLFERKEGFGKAGQFIRSGGAVGILVDQHAGDAGLWCPFFGRLASTSTLAATLALRTGSRLVPAVVHTIGEARWRFAILPRLETKDRSAEAITAEVNIAVEGLIRASPADWFWVHNRWKTPKPKFLLGTYKRGIFVPDQTTNHQSPITNHLPLQPFRILVRASNWLGDAVMSAPAVQAIRRGRPDARVTVLTPSKLADFWRVVPGVDEVLTIEPGEGVLAVAEKLRAGNFEAAVLFPNSMRVALEAWFAGIPRRVGYPGHRREWLLNQVFREKKKSRLQAPRHQVHQYLALANFIGAAGSSVNGDWWMVNGPATTTGHQLTTINAVPAATNHQSLITNRAVPHLALCPGAEYGPAKRWLPERFAEVMSAVHEQTGGDWKLLGVAKDQPVAEAILSAAPCVPATDLTGQTTLAGLIEELRTCDLLLTNDTGTMHLAAFLGVPTVSLFGSTEPALTGPLGAMHHVIRHHVACSPCFLRECPIDFRCMRAIETDEVVHAVCGIIRKQGNLRIGA